MERLAGTWGSPQTPLFRNRIKIRKLEQGNLGHIMLSREGRVAAGRGNGLFPFKGIFSSRTKSRPGRAMSSKTKLSAGAAPGLHAGSPLTGWGLSRCGTHGAVSALPQSLHHHGFLPLCSHTLLPFQDYRLCLCCSLCPGGGGWGWGFPLLFN